MATGPVDPGLAAALTGLRVAARSQGPDVAVASPAARAAVVAVVPLLGKARAVSSLHGCPGEQRQWEDMPAFQPPDSFHLMLTVAKGSPSLSSVFQAFLLAWS